MPDTIKQVMTQDHKHCDDLFTQLDSLVMDKKWDQAKSHAANMIANFLYHFKHEEEVLFPEFEAVTNNKSGPTVMMRHEHKQMCELLNELKQAVNNKNFERYSGLSETLNIFIQQHNMKEEGILYPMIDNACAQNKDQLIQGMVNRIDNKVA